MKCLVHLLTNIILVMNIDGIDVLNLCADQQYSPLCFCRASYQNSSFTDLFLARLILSQCENSLPIHHCGQSQFNPPSFRFTHLVPQVTNVPHCLEDVNCFHNLHSKQHCQGCKLIYNDSSYTKICFNFCEQNPSCGTVCFNQPILISINCSSCHGQVSNITCRCINPSSCLPLFHESTTPRWMQKRGFPAAVILALVMLAGALLVIAVKLIYRQLDLLDRRRSLAARQSMLSGQDHQILSPNNLDIPTIIHTQSQQLVVDIHRCDDENELNILLVEKNLKN